jgi:hypothetical protein
MRPPVHLDFIRPRSRRPVLGLLLLGIGVVAAAATVLGYQTTAHRRQGLELRLAAFARASHPDPENGVRLAAEEAAADQTAQELVTPWTSLLAELESASQDSTGAVSVLAVEPDHAKHKVHVNGESKTLALAIAYVQRLQSSHLLKYPMLDSHAVRSDDPLHPVRFELTGDWQDER